MTKIYLKEIKTKSNMLSLFRLFLAIPLFFLFEHYHEARYWIIFVLIIAAITDNLDGYLARKYNEITEFGKIIDPLADKVIVITVVVLLYYFKIIDTLFFWVIVLRDVLILLGGIYFSKKLGKVLPSNYVGKITVAAIGFFLLTVISGIEKSNWLYLTLYYLSLFLSFTSVIVYLFRAIEAVKWSKNENV
jgi:CDP-diacylglycerol--glycerol-3-phosphate 3-phosphatidyltransferase